MNATSQYLISKDEGTMQMSYAEYETLIEKLEEARHIQQTKNTVMENLQRYLNGHADTVEEPIQEEPQTGDSDETHHEVETEKVSEEETEKVSVEFSPDNENKSEASPSAPDADGIKAQVETPPIKKEVEDHFNVHDESGRLLNVFKQFYTCLNESCRGVVRVTMKDGISSLWNYDKWEEFAFVDIHEGELRFSVDPRYTEDLSSLEFCEVPRLLASRRKLISIRVGDLNQTMLEVLNRAFEEVGLAAG